MRKPSHRPLEAAKDNLLRKYFDYFEALAKKEGLTALKFLFYSTECWKDGVEVPIPKSIAEAEKSFNEVWPSGMVGIWTAKDGWLPKR